MDNFRNNFRLFSVFCLALVTGCTSVTSVTPYCRHRAQGEYTHKNHDWENIKAIAECGYNVHFEPLYTKTVDKSKEVK